MGDSNDSAKILGLFEKFKGSVKKLRSKKSMFGIFTKDAYDVMLEETKNIYMKYCDSSHTAEDLETFVDKYLSVLRSYQDICEKDCKTTETQQEDEKIDVETKEIKAKMVKQGKRREGIRFGLNKERLDYVNETIGCLVLIQQEITNIMSQTNKQKKPDTSNLKEVSEDSERPGVEVWRGPIDIGYGLNIELFVVMEYPFAKKEKIKINPRGKTYLLSETKISALRIAANLRVYGTIINTLTGFLINNIVSFTNLLTSSTYREVFAGRKADAKPQKK